MRAAAIAVLLCAMSLACSTRGAELSDANIRNLLIRQSIAAYPGNCPCPYNLDRAGRRCGARSAYSKPGGYQPLCYPHDVTDEMIARFRQRQ
jgi:hypothetical protein